ncbi:MAG: flagellar hook-associated protein FlgK [Deltaproteobacteria bacterium GWA2_55_10]|nr:MAG: flagellar hook-associated protein FlgK [Deltaproteobacteria bacterium GWA2_55_10]
MSSLNAVFDIAKSALMATQKAMNVTSHNISNANTDGYTRQRAELTAKEPVIYGGLYFGTGVDASNIQRVYDSFNTIQLRTSVSLLSRHETAGGHLSGLEAVMNGLDGSSLSTRLDALFNSFEEVATNPSSYGERSALLANANALADSINTIDSGIRLNIANINGTIEGKVDEVNSLALRIAELNGQIAGTELAGIAANDLRDKRDILLEDLANIVDISVTENGNGQADVFLGGSFIVAGTRTSGMSLAADPREPESYNIILNGATINSRISGGSLKGDLEGLAYYQGVHDKVNLLSASLVKEVNQQHAAGFGLDGSSSTDFFAPLSVYTRGSVSNSGGAIVSSAFVDDLSQVTLDDYEIRFAGPGSYTVVNTSTNMVVTGGAYTSGNPITFDGLNVTIQNSPLAPAAGDRFTVSVMENAARDFSVAITDANKVAASSTAAGVPGDNANATALADLRDALTVEGATFGSFFQRVVTDLGTEVNNVKLNARAQKAYSDEIRAARESVSGVSLEEEAINLVKLQRAFEAAAKVMQTADQMLETLLNIR